MREKSITRQLAQIETLSQKSCIKKFKELYGREPTQVKNLTGLRAQLAFRVQELYYGGISEETKAKMKELAAKDSLSNLCRPVKSTAPNAGQHYVREWDGERHEAIVHDNGKFEYRGQFFRSLTAVADYITGTHISGNTFFKVNRKNKNDGK